MREISETKSVNLENCVLARKTEGMIYRPSPERPPIPERLPENKGRWDGLSGHSKWTPDPEYVPLQSNPEGKDWESILAEYGIDGINFRWGEPDFRPVSKGEVTVEPFTENRLKNFNRADKELAQRRGCAPAEVRQWRHEHGYTWHECRDMKTMQKVPSVIHNNVAHSGGIARIKLTIPEL